MNAKTAKKLRKITLGMVVAAEQQSGKPIEQVAYKTVNGRLVVAANTGKGAYKALKKGVRNGTIG